MIIHTSMMICIPRESSTKIPVLFLTTKIVGILLGYSMIQFIRVEKLELQMKLASYWVEWDSYNLKYLLSERIWRVYTVISRLVLCMKSIYNTKHRTRWIIRIIINAVVVLVPQYVFIIYLLSYNRQAECNSIYPLLQPVHDRKETPSHTLQLA